MSLNPGSRLGAYEITALLGEGGMGQVYRARDTKLDRDVAIKVLPESFALDADRVARFTREAKTLAALNHPNIAQIYGIEDGERLRPHRAEDDVRGEVSASVRAGGGAPAPLEERGRGPYLVMELVEGDDLSTLIARGPLSPPTALPIAKQIADALEAAHEQGIVHRDLKPANVKVRADGTVKVLDFGLAKAMDPARASSASASALANSPTITSPAMTEMGMILGTAAYMSPEQASGRPVDRRSDLWAFGVVLLEMLTGRRTFDGETVSHVLASVLKDTPDLTALPADTPAPIRRLLRRCLEKNPKRRIDSAAAARLEIDAALSGGDSTDGVGGPALADHRAGRPSWKQWLPAATIAAVLALLLAGLVAWNVWPTPPTTLVRRFSTALPEGMDLRNTGRVSIAIAPDASAVVYNTTRGLYLRPADALEGHLLPGTEDTLLAPVFSPDGQQIAYAEGRELKRIAVTGGAPVVIASDVRGLRGLIWPEDDTILFGGGDGIYRVPASRGTPERIIPAHEGEVLMVTDLLPDGRSVLYTVAHPSPDVVTQQVAVQTIGGDDRTVLVEGGSDARCLPSGYLVYANEGALFGVAFDPTSRTVSGGAVSIVDGVRQGNNRTGRPQYSVAASGDLIYAQAGGPELQRTLAWVDRQGREDAIPVPPRFYVSPRISPDGARIAVDAWDDDQDLWLYDIAGMTMSRLTFSRGRDMSPVWTSDGRRLLFSGESQGLRPNLFWIAADGTGAAEQLATSQGLQAPTGVTPDGTRALFMMQTPGGNHTLQVELSGSHTVTPLIETAASYNGVVSPNGKWLAYEATDTGTSEVYVRPYPEVNSGRWQVSTSGGRMPLWSRDGRELFYVTPAGALMRVGVTAGASWGATPPAMLLGDGRIRAQSTSPLRTYDIAPDGQRFVVLKEPATADLRAAQIVVIEGFDALLKQRVPTQ